MKFIFKIILTLCLLLSIPASGFCMEKVFYILHSKATATDTLSVIKQHARSINIIISQAYHIDKNGDVDGFVDPDILQFTQTHSIKFMAMITNLHFDQALSHEFLSRPNAEEHALNSIIELCEHYHFYGVQFDFEMIPLDDRAALTHFYQYAAEQLHKHGIVVSFAVAPITSDSEFSSLYQKRIYTIWQGAYDLNALGKAADFVTIMTYNQHLGHMAPGPIASVRWTEAVVKHVLKHIPARKISLGIPTYSGFWYTGAHSSNPPGKITIQQDEISYTKAMQMLAKYHGKLKWDASDKVAYAFYEHNWLNEYLFVENARAFRTKLALAKKYHLRGISVFRIGTEDPDIWNFI